MKNAASKVTTSCKCQAPGFWSLFALSLGLSLLCTFAAVAYQRHQQAQSASKPSDHG